MALQGRQERFKTPIIFLLSFLFGWGSYSLKLVSVVKLIEDMGIKAFPLMMILQAGVFLLMGRLLEWLANKMPKYFHVLIYFISGLLVLSVNLAPKLFHLASSQKLIISALTFLGSVVLVSAYELSTRNLQSQHLSLLQFPNQSGQLMFVTELGIILGSIGVLVLNDNFSLTIPFWGALPFFIGIPMALLLVEETPVIKAQAKNNDVKLAVQNYPFYINMIILMGVILLVKYVQGLATLLGMIDMNQATKTSIAVIFSKLNILQTVLIICALIPTFFRKKEVFSWSRGVSIYFVIQGTLLFIMGFYSPIYFMIGAGMVRKLLQHIFLSQSTSLLESSIPEEIRMTLRRHQENFAQAGTYVLMAVFSALIFYFKVPAGFLWAFTGCVAIFGLWVRQKLHDRLDEFQVGTIVTSDIYRATAACYSLANKNSARHHIALVSLLERGPRAMLAKAIIFALGKMGREQSIDVIIKYLNMNDREDVQLVGVKALSHFNGYVLDMYFTHCLEDLINKQTSLGELRVDVFRAIADRINIISTITVLRLLKQSEGNQNAISNCLILLGELAVKNNDRGLFDVISTYLDLNHPRRVRTNAILYLFHSPKYHHLAMEGIDSFLTSKDSFDRSAVAFLAGELKLKGLLPYVIENSIEHQHKNSTLLISLMRMEHADAYEWFVDFIVSANNREQLTAMNQFNTIKSQSTRFKMYFVLMKKHPEKVQIFLDILRETRRNYDDDRKLIRFEALNKGIELRRDTDLFSNDSEKDVGPMPGEAVNPSTPTEIKQAA